ncbi:MAG: hypothetical protein ACFFDI_10045 [Promethearchaeota archaeon]
MERNELIRLVIGLILMVVGISIATLGGNPATSGFFTSLGDIGVILNASLYIFGLIAAFIGLFIIFRVLRPLKAQENDSQS